MNVREYLLEKLANQAESQTDADYHAEKNRDATEEIVEAAKKKKKKKLLVKKLEKKKKPGADYVMPVENVGEEEGEDSDNEQSKLSWQVKLARASHMANPILSIRMKKKPKKFARPSTILPALLAGHKHK